MANNYLQYSSALKFDTDAEKKWLSKFLPLLTEAVEEVKGPDALWQELARDAEVGGAMESYRLVRQFVREEECYQAYDLEDGDDYFWLYAEEGGSPELVLAFVHIFMAHFQKEGYFELTWAAWCDKLRIDEFGGGAGFSCRKGYDCRPESWWVPDAAKAMLG